LDEAFGFTVGAWPVDAGVAAFGREPARCLDPGACVVGVGVVGQDALDDETVLAVPGGRPLEEAAAAVGVLAG
jgi:hypothetical protein